MIEADQHKQVPEDGLMWLGPAQGAQKMPRILGKASVKFTDIFVYLVSNL